MNGWIISFLSDSAQNTTENVDYKDDYCSLSWSPYDRICIEKAETFEKLCTASSVVKKLRDWQGSERTMHIIPDPKNTHKDIWELSESKQKIILMPVYVYFSVLFSETKNVVFVFVLRR